MSAEEIKRIYEAYFDQILRYLQKRIRSEEMALDLAQDTFVQALKYYQKNKIKNERAYIFKCAYHTLVTHQKKKGRFEEESLSSEQAGRFVDQDFKLLREGMNQLLQKEDVYLYEIFGLRVDYQLTHDEIAEVTGKSKSTVRRSFDKIQTLLYNEFKDDLNIQLGAERD